MPQIVINNIRLKRIKFMTNPLFFSKEEDIAVPIRYNLSIRHEYDDNVLIVHINVKSPTEEEDKNSPFYFDIIVTGVFKLIGEVEDSLINQYAQINCPAIIFPYLREILADITRRSGFPPFHLQPVNFVKLNKKESVQVKPRQVARKRHKKKELNNSDTITELNNTLD